jgi:SanA protein
MRPQSLIKLGILAVDIIVAGVFASNLAVDSAAKGKIYSSVELIPHRRIGLVLGCPKRVSDGRMNLFFIARVNAAAELYRQGKVDYLVASGDNRTPGDDEPEDLKHALVDRGVPAEKIYMDYAGISTHDSVVRARDVFGQTDFTVISQKFQNQRAIFIANHSKLDAIGFNAQEVFSGRTVAREALARAKAVLYVYAIHIRPLFVGWTSRRT